MDFPQYNKCSPFINIRIILSKEETPPYIFCLGPYFCQALFLSVLVHDAKNIYAFHSFGALKGTWLALAALFTLPASCKYDTVSEMRSRFFCLINWICSLGAQGQGKRGKIMLDRHA